MKDLGLFKIPDRGLQLETAIAAGDASEADHLFRYYWAWHLGRRLSPDRVLDLGCGGGYGCKILSRIPSSPTIVGCDKEAAALNIARADYADPNIIFKDVYLENHWEGELLKPARLVTCFEVFELLKHREFFLEQLLEHLKPEVFLLSANFLGRSSCHSNPADACFHYTLPMLFKVLRRYFEVVSEAGTNTVKDKTNPFVLRDHYNAVIGKARPGKPFTVGDNCVFCTGPRF